jgi:photosynthetic reaction center H subunit
MPLRTLSKTPDYRFAAGTCDVRDWKVRTRADGEDVGKVDDVLVDDAGTARYLDVDLGIFRKHVLLPIGQAQVDTTDDVVWVTGMTKEQLEDIPSYDHDATRIDDAYETSLGRAYRADVPAERYYDRPEYLAPWWRAHRHEEASADVGTTHARLRRLGELDDYEVADDDPDPRGWTVEGRDGERIGTVQELIVQPAAMTVRYLDVELDRYRDRSASEPVPEDRHVLVPVGFARLDADKVVLDAFSAAQLGELPAHPGDFDRSYEDDVRTHYGRRLTGENRYLHPMYRADIFYAPRDARR